MTDFSLPSPEYDLSRDGDVDRSRANDDLASVVLVLLAVAGGLTLVIVPSTTWMQLVGGLSVAGLVAAIDIRLLKRLLLAVVLLEIPLQIDIYVNYDALAAAENANSGYNFSVTTVALFMLYVLWTVETVGRRTAARTHYILGIPTIAYFCTVIFSTLVAEDVVRSTYEIVLLGQVVLVFFYLLHAVRTRDDVIFVMLFLMADLIIQGLLTASAGVLGVRPAVGPVAVGALGDRIAGTLGHPNSLGAFLILLLAPALACCATLPSRFQRVVAALGFGFGLVALVLSASRGAWLGAILSVAIFAVVGARRGWLRLRTLVLLCVCGVVVVALSWGDVLDRLGQYDNDAAQARLPLMILALRVVEQSPLIGVGVNNFALAMKDYITVDFANAWISTVHNKYLLVWGETGIVGLATFCWVLASAIRAGLGGLRWDDRLYGSLVVAFASALLGAMVHMSVAIYHSRPHLSMIWLVAGMIAALSNVNAETSESRELAWRRGGAPPPRTSVSFAHGDRRRRTTR